MFSPKMLVWTVISLLFSLSYGAIYDFFVALPVGLARVLIVLVAIGVVLLLRAYTHGALSKESMLDKITGDVSMGPKHHTEKSATQAPTSAEDITDTKTGV